MHAKRKVLTAVLVALTLGVSPLAAQITSNTSNATSGLFLSDTDNFLNVNNWQKVEFDNFFTAMQIRGTDGIGAGLALNAGRAFLGFGYIGNLWNGTVNEEITEYGSAYSVNPAWAGMKSTARSGTGLQWNNRIFFLLGTELSGGLLFDIDFAKAGKNNLNADELDAGGDAVNKEKTEGLGAIEAGLRWGRNFKAGGGLTIKPNLAFRYNIDLQKNVTYDGPGDARITELNGKDNFFAAAAYGNNTNDGIVGLKGYVTAHAGVKLDLAKNATDGSLWLKYDFADYLYGNQTIDNTDYWKNYNPFRMDHSLTLGVGAWYTMDRKLSLGWSAESGFGLVHAKITSEQESFGAIPNDPNHEFTEALFGIIPSIAAGVVYRALPDKFNLNAGIVLYPIMYTYNKFTDNDTVIVKAVTKTTNTISSARAETLLGFTWFITDGFAFDAAVSLAGGSGANGSRLNLTDFSALLSYKR